MAPVILVTGGVRSGKSRYAEGRLKDSARVVYIATARCLDSEMERRIQLHQQGRPAHWVTAEATRDLDQVLERYPEGDVFFDCVGNMVTNLMLDAEPDYDGLSMARIEEIEAEIFREFDKLTGAAPAEPPGGAGDQRGGHEPGFPLPHGPGVRRYSGKSESAAGRRGGRGDSPGLWNPHAAEIR